MPQLDFSTYIGQFFWLAVLFAALFVAVRWYVVPKMNSIAARRAADLEETLQRAEKLRSEAEKLQARYENTMRETRIKARASVREKVGEAEAVAARKMAALDEELKAKLQKSDAELQETVSRTLKEAAEQKLVESLAAKAQKTVTRGDG